MLPGVQPSVPKFTMEVVRVPSVSKFLSTRMQAVIPGYSSSLHNGYTQPPGLAPARVRKISKWAGIFTAVVILELDWQVLGRD